MTGGYSAVALNNAAVSLVGISGFTLNVANLDVLFNGAPTASRLDWTAIPELTGYDGLVSTLSFKVAGDVGLSLASDLVVASGSFTLAKFDLTPGMYGAVTLPAGASALEFTLHLGLVVRRDRWLAFRDDRYRRHAGSLGNADVAEAGLRHGRL